MISLEGLERCSDVNLPAESRAVCRLDAVYRASGSLVMQLCIDEERCGEDCVWHIASHIPGRDYVDSKLPTARLLVNLEQAASDFVYFVTSLPGRHHPDVRAVRILGVHRHCDDTTCIKEDMDGLYKSSPPSILCSLPIADTKRERENTLNG